MKRMKIWHPTANPQSVIDQFEEELTRMVFAEAVARKEKQWESMKD